MIQADAPRRPVRCPSCGKTVEWDTGNAFRPFCSERCKKGDLAAWASDQYRVPGAEPDPGMADGPEPA